MLKKIAFLLLYLTTAVVSSYASEDGVCFALDDSKRKLYTVHLKPNATPINVAIKKDLVSSLSSYSFGEGGAYRAVDKMLYIFNRKFLYRVDPSTGTVTLEKTFTSIEFPKDLVSGASFYFNKEELKDWLYVTAVGSGPYDGDGRAILYKIDPNDNWKVVKSTPLTGDSNSRMGILADADALAINPENGESYVIVDNSSDGRVGNLNHLYKLDLNTGITKDTGVIIPPKRDREALSFADDGNLYIANSDESSMVGSEVDDYLYMIDMSKNQTYIAAQIPPEDNVDIEGLTCNNGDKEVASVPKISIKDADVLEGPSGEMATIEFKIDSNIKVSDAVGSEGAKISYELIEGSATENVDYKSIKGSFFITSDSYELKLPVVIGDNDIESDETFIVKFTSDSVLLERENIKATIIDDDANIHLNAYTTPIKSSDKTSGDITTQITNKSFNVHIAAYNDVNGIKTLLSDDIDITKIELVHNYLDNDPTNDVIEVLLDPLKDKPLVAHAGLVDFTTLVKNSYKDVKIRVTASYRERVFIDDSLDNFAIRPKAFSFPSSLTNQKFIAGSEHDVKIYALDGKTKSAKQYNEKEGVSFKISVGQNKSGCNYSASDLTKNFSKAFVNGDLNGSITYNNVGILDLNISEIVGSEFANVDSDDTSIADRLISPATTTIEFVPNGFKVTALFVNTHNSNGYAYYSNDMTNAPHLDITVSALDYLGNVVKNYDNSCVSQDMDLNVTVDINASVNDTIILKTKDSGPINDKLVTIDNSGFNELNKTFKIGQNNFSNGSATTSVQLSLQKNKMIAKNPALIKVPKIIATDSNNVSSTVSLTTNNDVQFQDMRIYLEDPVSVIGKKTLNVSVYYETYDDGHSKLTSINTGKNSISGDSRWWVVDKAKDIANKMIFTNTKARYQVTNRSQPQNVANTTIKVTTQNIPEKNTITADPTPEFQSGFTKISTDISFVSSGKWAGKGDTGVTVDNNVSKREGFKKLNW